ncbi:hypothetical protein PG993_008284 [Apiospora rasikravindrae]|uniref:Secreted protein n=1 Tax=Apiospora rasikravindrae TaxID=990691 RepID=A0ABR1T296_9PEZI
MQTSVLLAGLLARLIANDELFGGFPPVLWVRGNDSPSSSRWLVVVPTPPSRPPPRSREPRRLLVGEARDRRKGPARPV